MTKTATGISFEEYKNQKGNINPVFKNNLTLILENLREKHLPSLTHDESDLGLIIVGVEKEDIERYTERNWIVSNESNKFHFMIMLHIEIGKFYKDGNHDILIMMEEQKELMQRYLVIKINDKIDEEEIEHDGSFSNCKVCSHVSCENGYCSWDL